MISQKTGCLSILTAIFQVTWVSRYQKVFILDFIGAKGDGGGGNNWSYKTCKAAVKCETTNQHSVFYRPDVLPVTLPTVSKHWRENVPVVDVNNYDKFCDNLFKGSEFTGVKISIFL